jgi:hypothetical protein
MSFFSFFFYEIREQEGRAGPASRFGTSGRGQVVGKECGRVNMVQILCSQVCKCKTDSCWNYSRNGGIKQSGGKGLIQVWYVWYVVRTFINVTVYLQHAQQYKKVTGVDLLQRTPKALFQYPALPNKSPCTMCNFYAQWLQRWNLFKFQECSKTLSPTALENRKKWANPLYFEGIAKVNFPYLRITLLKKLYRSFFFLN